MIRFGAREYMIPTWLRVALPLAAVGYVAVDLAWHFSTSPVSAVVQTADEFPYASARFASAYLAAFLVVDIASRSRTPWYGLLLLILLAHLVAAFVVADMIVQPLRWLSTLIVGAAVIAAAAPRGPSGGEVLAFASGALAIVPASAALAALFVTLVSRMAAGLSLLAREARRAFWANLAAAMVWLPVGLAGSAALRTLGPNISPWVVLSAALLLALAAIYLHLLMVRRIRREQPLHDGRFRTWLAAAFCSSALILLALDPIQFFSLGMMMPGYARPVLPTVFGLYIDRVRPAFRAIGILPTPVLAVAGYRVDVPFDDRTTMVEPAEAAGGYDVVRVTLPADYGVTTAEHVPSVAILRSAAILPSDLFWSERHLDLEQAASAAQPGQDVVLRRESAFGRDVGLRSSAYPEVEFWLRSVDPAISWAVAERALHRFLQERLRRAN
jgi:hypothetical protein